MSGTLDLAGGKLHLYKRENSDVWQCSAYMAGRNHRISTKERDRERAQQVAEDWYFGLRVKKRTGELVGGPTFAQAAAKFLPEYETITAGERNPKYVKQHGDRLRVHLLPFFGNKPVSVIGPQTAQDYRVHRRTKPKEAEAREAAEAKKVIEAKKAGKVYKPKKSWTAPANSTLKAEIVTLRLALRTAQRLGWIAHVPDLSPPYRGSGKISHRAWFSLDEYNELCRVTRDRARNPPQPRWKWECEQLNNFVVFMVNTGLRPDEAARLEFRDVKIVEDKPTGETILEIQVRRGKRGVGYCKSMPGAVYPFEQLRGRKRLIKPRIRCSNGGERDEPEANLALPQPSDLIFPDLRHHHLNAVLEEVGLKLDPLGQRRSAYSLRHTYICLRLMEGADIYAIAKNCRTSVEMIEKYYAAHISNTIDTTKTNVRSKDRPDGRPKGRATNVKRPKAASSGGYPMRRR